MMFDPERIKSDFPVFKAVSPYGKRLIYCDNAASAQKPSCVLDAMHAMSVSGYANVHRGLHYLANQATDSYEQARISVQNFLGASSPQDIIWTSGATDGINLVSYALSNTMKVGDEIILSIAEHHSNIIPWHFLRERYGVVLRWVNIQPDGMLDLDHYRSLLNHKTRLVAITHMSNILGTINPIKQMIADAHHIGALVLVDGSQAAVHMPVNVQELNTDFYIITGHKLYGPTGIGAVYMRAQLADTLQPFKGGGEMIDTVTCDHVTYNTSPHRFEAGTPPIVQAVGLGQALAYIQNIGFNNIIEHENNLRDLFFQKASCLPQMTLYGTNPNKGSVFSFNIQGVHPHDLATYLDRCGIAVRAGHHCGQPLMKYLGVNSTARASFAVYNTEEDIHEFFIALEKAINFFSQI